MSIELNKESVEQADASSCQGTNCGTTTGDHSSECLAEAAAGQGWELKPGDLCGRDCPIHKISVEQAGGDERAALQELIRVRDWVKNRRGQPEKLKNTGQTYIMIEKCETLDMLEWAIERARAALAHRAPEVCSECSDTGKVYDESGDGPWSCYACTGNPEVIGYANGDELDNMLDDRTAVLSPGKTSFHTVPVYRLIRAALAQPSPKCATCGGTGMVDDGEITCSQGGIPYENGPVKCVKDCPDCKAQPSPAQSEQAEAERPEVVGYLGRPIGMSEPGFHRSAEGAGYPGPGRKALIDLEQHARIVGALRAENAKLSEALDECDGDRWKLRSERDAANARLHEVATACATAEQERDAALARVAELTATRNRYGVDAHYFNKNLQRILRDFESFTPDELARSLIILAKVADEKVVAQAQHSVPELLEWAVGRWHAEVSLRPLINVHRRALDDTWRQVIRRLGGDTGLLCGPSHDELLAAALGKEGV
ncbi:TPA: hypothetical protein ACPFLH_001117 [Pseudomonas aeruginosa]